MNTILSKYGTLPNMTKVTQVLFKWAGSNATIFPVPGLAVFLAQGFDPYAKGVTVAATSRHANVLLISLPLSERLLRSAAVAYAQMPRPRVLVTVGADQKETPLPKADLHLDWHEINTLTSRLLSLKLNGEDPEPFAPSFLTEALKDDEDKDKENGHDHDHKSHDMGSEDGKMDMKMDGDGEESSSAQGEKEKEHDHGAMNNKGQEMDSDEGKMDMDGDGDDNSSAQGENETEHDHGAMNHKDHDMGSEDGKMDMGSGDDKMDMDMSGGDDDAVWILCRWS